MKKIIYFTTLFLFSGCHKEFLEIKPSQSQKVPVTLADYQAILDNALNTSNPMNVRSSHTLGILGADEYYMDDATFNIMPTTGALAYFRNAYIWNSEVFDITLGTNSEPNDFFTAYTRILRVNVVLEGIDRLNVDESSILDWKRAKGMAHFIRALNYYNLCQLFTEPFIGDAWKNKLGMPLRLEVDPTIKLSRSTLGDTYDQIIYDLQEAESNLSKQSNHVFRPSLAAVAALKMRINLQRHDYEGALVEANKVLENHNTLLDYNEVPVQNNYSFPTYGIGNPEVFYSTAAYTPVILSNNMIRVDEELLSLYQEGDLRKELFFKKSTDGRTTFWGSYFGNETFFTGFAVDEILLVKAEILARTEDVDAALAILNRIREKRIHKDHYTELGMMDADRLLGEVLDERRRQLIFRGVRWEDLRRLNKDTKHAKTLRRKVNDQIYELSPNDKKYVWPLPPDAITAGGFVQNDR